MRKLLTNLIRNAVESVVETARPGGVRVTARLDAPWLILEVEDDGGGVAQALRPTLFEPLVTSKPGGTGLGLAIAARVAAAHEGEVSLEDAPRGSRFVARFKVSAAGAG